MHKTPKGKKQLRTWCLSALFFWCTLTVGFLYLTDKNTRESAIFTGIEIGRSILKKDSAYGMWAVRHGSIYVPVTEENPPNPLLSHIPDREITSPQGKTLTLLNPAHMARQVFELEEKLHGIVGHLTSLNAIQPANKPDQWEKKALHQFNKGVMEVAEFIVKNEHPLVRVMIPIKTQTRCLKCHAVQGYKEGDIQGGLSVTVPITHIFLSTKKNNFTDRLFHLTIFLIGLAGLLTYYLQSRKQLTKNFKDEKNLITQDNHLKAIVDNMSNGLAVYNVLGAGENFIIKNINPAGLKSINRTLNDVKGKKITEAFPGVVEMGLLAAFKRVWKTGTPEHVPFTNYTDDRIFLWVENYVYKLPTGEIVAVFDDITIRKKAEETILLKTAEWEKTFDAIPDIITLQNRDMTIIRANQAAFEFFQMDPDELLGTTCHQLFRGESEPCPGCPGIDSFCDNKKHTSIIEHNSLDAVFHVNSAPIFDNNNEVQYFVYIAQDITNTKRLEDELFQAHKMEAIGTLAGGIAHDFNNILSAIIGYAELALVTIPEDSQAQKDVTQVLTASKRATELVKQILTFSRKNGQKKLPLKLHLIVKEALKLMRSSLPATIDIQSTIDQEHCMVLANPTGIHQIVVNLCTNALHAIDGEKGTLKLTLEQVTVDPAKIPATVKGETNLFVRLSVKDSGKGMDEKTAARIFEPYFTTKSDDEGTGLGLAVIHGIVEECLGFIEVETALGMGTTIHIYLPAIKTEESSITHDYTTKQLQTGTETVLVIDDEPTITDIAQTLLKSLGYTVVIENSSTAALKIFEAAPERFDLVITDQTMPDLVGTELAKRMLKLNASLPIILCSGYASTLTENTIAESGIKCVVSKPIDQRTLAEIVRSALDTH